MDPIQAALRFMNPRDGVSTTNPSHAQAYAMISIAQSLKALADTFKQAAAEGIEDRKPKKEK